MGDILKVSEVEFREDLYPRFSPSQELITRYSESIEYLPAIIVNQNGILIDGFHRLNAHKLAGVDTIACEVLETETEAELKKLAYMYNSNHGLQLSNEEKRRYAQEMIGVMEVKELSAVLSVSERQIRNWTESQRKAIKEEQNRRICELYLRAWNSQQSIADVLGIGIASVSRTIDSFQNGKIAEMEESFEKFIYNIWRIKGLDHNTKHFGAFPLLFMKNLLYYHTDPKDIVFDPFAGSGTTVDACKSMFRRYYCSDRKVIPGREQDIREHDITKGLPDDLPKPDFVFIDPPYWRQAKGRYSDAENDLGNMELDVFYESMSGLLNELQDRKVERIAVVIQPTQYANDGHLFEDHVFNFDKQLTNYDIEMRYILPYSTEQYNAQIVEKMKEERKCMVLNRDLIVWRLNK